MALRAQTQSDEPLGQVLISTGLVTEEQLYTVLAEQAGAIFIRNPRDYEPSEKVLGLMLRPDALRLTAVPIEERDGVITVATSDPRKKHDIEALIDRPIQIALARPNDIENLIDRLYPQKGRWARR
jgi:type IV pilus assembly protein PilB